MEWEGYTPLKTNELIPKMMGLGKGNSLLNMAIFGINSLDSWERYIFFEGRTNIYLNGNDGVEIKKENTCFLLNISFFGRGAARKRNTHVSYIKLLSKEFIQMSHEKNPPTFHYTGWLMGILIMAYEIIPI